MNKVQEIKKKNSISAQKMAEMLNITLRHYYDIETGKVQLGEDRIKKLCNLFDVTSDYLLGITDEPGMVKEKRSEDSPIAFSSRGDINIKELEKVINRAVKKALAEREKEEKKRWRRFLRSLRKSESIYHMITYSELGDVQGLYTIYPDIGPIILLDKSLLRKPNHTAV